MFRDFLPEFTFDVRHLTLRGGPGPLSLTGVTAENSYVQNPLDTFPRNFPVDGKVANSL